MRRALITVSIVFIVLFGALQTYLFLRRPTDPEELRERADRFPTLRLTELTGKSFSLPEGKPLVIVYFNSTCDHCERQISLLQQNAGIFEKASLVLISSQPLEVLSDFEKNLQFPSTTDVQVVHCDPAEVGERLGVLSLPQIFIYNAEGKLEGLFAGETTVKAISELLE